MTTKDVIDLADGASDKEVRHEAILTMAGFIAMSALVVATALGAFGREGLLAEGRSAAPGLSARFDRTPHRGTDAFVEFTMGPSAAPVRLALARAAFDAMKLERVMPTPVAVTPAGDDIVFAFAPAGPDRSVTVQFSFSPVTSGPLRWRAAVEGGGRVDIRQFVFP